MSKELNDLPLAEIRKSNFKLDDLLRRFSSRGSAQSNDITEALLCLGNEINKLKKQIKK